MRRLSRVETALFLLPLLIVPTAILGQRWKVANAPKPVPIPKPPPAPKPNLYKFPQYSQMECLLPSPNGKTIYSSHSGNPKFYLWNVKSGALIRRFGIFQLGNGDAVLSPNGKLIGSPHYGRFGSHAILFDSASGKEKLKIRKPLTKHSYGMALSNEVVALPTDDEMRLYSVNTGKQVGRLRHRAQDRYPLKPQFSGNGKSLLWIGNTENDSESYANSHSDDEAVWFDWKKRKKIKSFQFSQTSLYEACFSGDGKAILAYGWRYYWVKSKATRSAVATELKFFAIDAQTGKQLFSRHLDDDCRGDIAASPDGKWFAFPSKTSTDGGAEQFLSIYEVRTGKEVYFVEGDSFEPYAWSHDSKTLYLKQASLWKLQLQNNGNWKLDKNI